MRLDSRAGVEVTDNIGDEVGSFFIVVLDEFDAFRSLSSASHAFGCIQVEIMVIALTAD